MKVAAIGSVGSSIKARSMMKRSATDSSTLVADCSARRDLRLVSEGSSADAELVRTAVWRVKIALNGGN